jgi:excisionase family DNA binding protein
MEELLTVAEVAEILKLNQQTIRNWIDAGSLPHVRLGERRVRILRRDLDDLIADNYTGSKPIKPPDPESRSIWDGFMPDPIIPE